MIHLICALQCEANPLIQHYQLKKLDASQSFSVYQNHECNLSLTITGIGKLNAAAGAAYVHGFLKTLKSDGWLNIGTAGHQSMEIGKAVLAHRIEDASTNNVWFPQLVFTPPCSTQNLKTLDNPSTAYEEDLFDMEAAGFYATAIQFATSELIQSLKIISDNSQHPAEKLDKALLKKLVTENIEIIDQLINEMDQLSLELETLKTTPAYYEQCIDHWHFTQYERNRLYKLLISWSFLCPKQNILQHY
jgi:nucleoside phosphorylase